MKYSNNKQVEYDIQQFLKNPESKKLIPEQNFFEKYFIIVFLPFILSIILFLLLLLVGFDDYLQVEFMLPIIYIVCLYFCLVEYLSFKKIFKEYPEFEYVYLVAKKDKAKKKDFAYDKAVQKLYNQLIKRRTIAKKRLKYKFLIGMVAFIVIFLTILFGQPSASPVVIGIFIIFFFYFIIDLIMCFGGKGDSL